MTLYKLVWERLLSALPIVLMGVLALATYWLIRSTPPVENNLPKPPAGHTADYFMDAFSIRTFDAAGRIRTEVMGQKALHYPDTQWLEIDGIQIRTFDAQGRLTQATAQRGLTNDDASEVQLLGKAVVVREAVRGKTAVESPRMEYRGEFLHAYTKTEKVRSHLPVLLLHGNNRFTADALDFDNVEHVLQLRGRVRGTLVPQRKP